MGAPEIIFYIHAIQIPVWKRLLFKNGFEIYESEPEIDDKLLISCGKIKCPVGEYNFCIQRLEKMDRSRKGGQDWPDGAILEISYNGSRERGYLADRIGVIFRQFKSSFSSGNGPIEIRDFFFPFILSVVLIMMPIGFLVDSYALNQGFVWILFLFLVIFFAVFILGYINFRDKKKSKKWQEYILRMKTQIEDL
jgi:hypothetical protein